MLVACSAVQRLLKQDTDLDVNDTDTAAVKAAKQLLKKAKQEQQAKAHPKVSHVTHEIEWVDFQVESPNGQGDMVPWKFRRPVLVDDHDGKDIMGKRCHRRRIAYDDMVREVKEKQKKIAQGFVML